MDSLGNKLKSARENKGYTLEQVSNETYIAERYLQALETEQFSIFPGESYLQGFLKTYSEYLELDFQEVFSLYKAVHGEQELVHTDLLVDKPSRTHRIIPFILLSLVILAFLAGIVYWITSRPKIEAPFVEIHKPVQWTLENDSFERRLYAGDSLLVTYNDYTYEFNLTGIEDTVNIEVLDTNLSLDLNQEVFVDLDSNGSNDIQIIVSDFVKGDPITGAFLQFNIVYSESTMETAPDLLSTTVPAPSTSAGTQTLIFSSRNPYPFAIQVTFQNYCFFRWEIIAERARPDRYEEFFQKGRELNIQQIQNGARIGMSNAMAARVTVIGGGQEQMLDIGSAGEVVVVEIRWVRDDDSHYRLVLLHLE